MRLNGVSKAKFESGPTAESRRHFRTRIFQYLNAESGVDIILDDVVIDKVSYETSTNTRRRLLAAGDAVIIDYKVHTAEKQSEQIAESLGLIDNSFVNTLTQAVATSTSTRCLSLLSLSCDRRSSSE